MNGRVHPAVNQNPPSPNRDPLDDKYIAIAPAVEDSVRTAESWQTLLQDTVSLDPDLGLRLWLRIYADALIAWELDICTQLVSKWFPVRPQDAGLVSRFRTGIEAIKSERHRDALEMLEGLLGAVGAGGVEPLLSQTTRALLSVCIGRVLLYRRSEGQTALTDLDQARHHFEQAKTLAPDDSRAYAALAEYHRLVDSLDEARRMCDEAFARAPREPDAHVVRGLLLEGEERWDEAANQYEAAINTLGGESEVAAVSRRLERLFAPISGAVYLQLGRMLQEGRPERAHGAVEQAVKVGRPRAARLRIQNGDEHVEQTGLKRLGEILESVSRPAEAAVAYYRSGLLFLRRSDHKAAADLFARASSLDPGMPDVYWFLADALRLLSANPQDVGVDDPVEAALRVLDVWDEGYAIAPPSGRFVWAYLTRARSLAALAELQPDQATDHRWQACAALEQSLIFDRNQAEVWLDVARCHHSLGNYAVALQAVRMAIFLSKDSLDAQFEQAFILADSGGNGGTEAVRRLREELRALGDRPELQAAARESATAVGFVEAMILCWQRRPAEAIPLFDKAIDDIPGNLALRFLRANARRMAGDRHGALLDFAQVWEDTRPGGGAGDRVNLEIRAGAGNELGYYTEARAILAGLLDSGSGSPFGVRMGLCYSSLGLRQVEQADRYFEEALVHLSHPHDVRGALDDLEGLESQLGASEDPGPRDAVAHYKAVLQARAQTLPSIDEPGAAEEELRHVLEIHQPKPGSPSWFGAYAGLARLDVDAGRLDHAASRYQTILESDAGRSPARFSEARVALVNVASAEAQIAFAASERADLPRTLRHFRRSLRLRTVAGAMSTPVDLLAGVAGLIHSAAQRETLNTALQELAEGAATERDV